MALALYNIAAEMAELQDLRDAAVDEGDTAAVEVIDKQLLCYVQDHLAKKGDGIRGWLREQDLRATTFREEEARFKGLAMQAEANVERVKAYVLGVMQQFDLKRIKGTSGDALIGRRGNGGVRPLTIAQELMVPDKYLQVVTPVPLSVWNEHGMPDPDPTHIRVDKQAVRHDLELGIGVPGCRLEEKGEHLRVE